MPQVSRAASWWVPPQNATWDWQLAVPVDQTVDAQVYDIDLFENEASVMSSLHAQSPAELVQQHPRRLSSSAAFAMLASARKVASRGRRS